MSDERSELDPKIRRVVITTVVGVLVVAGAVTAFIVGGKAGCKGSVRTTEVPVQIRLSETATHADAQAARRTLEKTTDDVRANSDTLLTAVVDEDDVDKLRGRAKSIATVSSVSVGNPVTVVRHRRCG